MYIVKQGQPVHRSEVIDKEKNTDKNTNIQTEKYIDNHANSYNGRKTDRQDRERNQSNSLITKTTFTVTIFCYKDFQK